MAGMNEPDWESNDGTVRLFNADCRDVLDQLPENSIDAIVCDPPYNLSFMGKTWDSSGTAQEFQEWCRVWGEKAMRVAKPGAHLVAFGGTRTYHRLVSGLEDAGWEIRDQLDWVFGSGFPKSLDVSKAIDKAAGAERKPNGKVKLGHEGFANRGNMSSVQSLKGTMGGEGGFARPWMDDPEKVEAYHQDTDPATEEAAQWSGWGTALKPAHEPIVLARKPLIGTVSQNVLEHGTGAINVDACRVATNGERPSGSGKGFDAVKGFGQGATSATRGDRITKGGDCETSPLGRWPANFIHDGSDEVVSLFPVTSSGVGAVKRQSSSEMHGNSGSAYGAESRGDGTPMIFYGDTGSAARFFYCAKASRSDRNAGCENIDPKDLNWSNGTQNPGSFQHEGTDRTARNGHPTVKPTSLMRWLCRLVTPPGGLIFDGFLGSGSTGRGAVLEGFRFIGCEKDTEEGYFQIAIARIQDAIREAERERNRVRQKSLF